MDEDLGEAGVEEGTKQALDTFENALLEFCLALLKRKVRSREYELPLVCALAVLGVQDGDWKWVDSYPPILSEMIKLSRFFVAQKAFDMTETSESVNDAGEDGEIDDSESAASGVTESGVEGTVDHITKMMDDFMVRGSHGAMQWMLDLRTYGMKIWFSTTAEGKVDWKDGDTVLYRDLQFKMSDLRGFVHSLVGQARRILHEDLLFAKMKDKTLPKVPWRLMVDNPVDGSPNWNFIQDERNPWPTEGKDWLWDRIIDDPNLSKRFRSRVGSEWSWNRVDIEKYMQSVVDFRAKLMILMHTTSGQPARGTELTTIRHSNTAGGKHRNVFIEDGRVVFVTRYHKGYNIKGDVKIIHRYLPREVGDLFVKYLWLVLPFQRQIELSVYGNTVDTVSAHVWPADPSTGKRWESSRLTKELKHESMAGLGQKVGVQAWRDLAIAISRKFLRGKEQFKPDEGDEEGKDEDEEDAMARAADEQAGHDSHVAGMVYARGIDEMSGAVASKRRRFLLSSKAWHMFLGFQDRLEVEEARGKKREGDPELESTATDIRMTRWKRLRLMDPMEELKGMAGESAVFRGVQEPAIRAIMEGKSPVVAVMATGEGKSMLFMLPALCGPSGMTIVVVPLIALRQDMMRRCVELGIVCKEWTQGQHPDGANIVLVTPESAVSEAFWTFVVRSRRSQRLDRIVIDECHVVLNRSRSFRPAMARLGELSAAERPMVLLTATLPPQEEGELWSRMGFEAETVFMFRARTTRKNIRYEVVQCGAGAEAEGEAVEALVAKVREELGDEGKVIVYCKQASKVKTLARLLGCEGYHSQAKDKAKKMEAFCKGEQNIIVATSALGLGVDIPDIRAVIHADVARNILEFAQESGRAGRDRKASRSIVVAAERWEEEMEFDWREETDEAKEMVRRFIDGEAGGCRRKVMDEYLDGYTERVGCIIEEEEICDQCRARGGEVHRSRQATAEEASQVGEVRRDHEKEAYQQLERGYSAQRRRFYEAAKGARKVEEEIGFEGEEEVEGGQEVGGEEEVEGEQGPEQFKEEETVNARAERAGEDRRQIRENLERLVLE